MVAKKAHEVENVIQKPDPRFRVILLYGPDAGLVSERADLLAAKTGVDFSDPFAMLRLNADDAAATPVGAKSTGTGAVKASASTSVSSQDKSA